MRAHKHVAHNYAVAQATGIGVDSAAAYSRHAGVYAAKLYERLLRKGK
jgi:hypothetical protein